MQCVSLATLNEVLEATERMWSRVFERALVRNAYANILALRVNADELTISAAFGAGVDALNSLSTGQNGSTDVRVGRILDSFGRVLARGFAGAPVNISSGRTAAGAGVRKVRSLARGRAGTIDRAAGLCS